MTKQETAIELEVAEMTDEQVPNQAAQALVESREILPTVDHPVEVEPVDLKAPELYINRELSHLQFNVRVLEQSLVERHPLLERLMFLLIFSSNLDEFFEIRVADQLRQLKYGREVVGPDAMYPKKVLEKIREICHINVERQYRILNEIMFPEMERQGIHFLRRRDWTAEQLAWVREYFEEKVVPVISPIGLDPAHPFPRLVNKSLNFIVELDGKDAFGRETGMAIIPAPRSLPRLIRMPDELSDGGDNLIFLSSIIHQFADELFPGMKVKGCFQFRITRNADLTFDFEEMDDLARTLRGELHSRKYGDAVRLEVDNRTPEALIDFLMQEFHLSDDQVYKVDGPVNLTRLMAVRDLVKRPELRWPPFSPGVPNKLKKEKEANVFNSLKGGDQLLLHPFQSFTPVVDLIMKAAKDPDVIAIKQTLYRTGDKSDIVNALVEAARAGKEVTVVIELRARFDEESNLHLASRLQEAGCLVVYGVVGYKTHAKLMLIVRREGSNLVRYCHLGTGNYHSGTARLYTDYSYLTSNDEIGEDVHKVFQQLTGMGKIQRLKKIFNAPFTLHTKMIELVQREAKLAASGKPGHVIVKVNGLTEPKMIRALYEASQAGVKIELIIRGMCRLRPGLPGISENITVRSVIGRFLEHTRVCYFGNNGNPEVFCASADWMERNMLHRVETGFPLSGKLAERVKKELDYYLADNTESWELKADGSYNLLAPEEGEPAFSAQQQLLQDFAS
ncbi:polyphosphate kinase 1 [Neptunomonas phycophila]|mgnify:CR=1 FL=1|uniref:Polyphosphate kinase n=1 Tax=Neptunomonas phycophila TaxID=1572645 RepID=A0AAW7XIW6_9GAMM|nr:polyphosphate kinase 1 [Neptunomonas phycophila]MBT3145319.1 polyphosphate kinase 1 [Neptunomonas phycophila]MDO6453567.1 polyphosphate kinase 1 [Neptunomonas phycophila]MDO6468281.1 polyphosphate kinase 1 [Neptunomonas phycophila]MDP2522290.1 polyphosphate kinase 1 [Neptunomonas phycophila]